MMQIRRLGRIVNAGKYGESLYPPGPSDLYFEPLAKAMTRSLVLGGLTAVEHPGWFLEQKEQNARVE